MATTRIDLARQTQVSADVDWNSKKITSLADPTGAQDAATKAYVDAARQGLDVKDSVRAATTANITLSGTQTVDGVSLSVGERVLVKNQTSAPENGLYLVASGSWTRTTDADTSAKVTTGMYVWVSEGTVNLDSAWVLTTNDAITLGSTSLTFVLFASAAGFIAGAGMTKSGNTIDVVAADNSMTVNADSIQAKLSATGSLSVAGDGLALTLSSNKGLEIVSNAVGIKLNGSSLTLGASGLSVTTPTPTFVVRETPSGTMNGSNVTFTLANTPTAGSEEVFLNGILQESGASQDYTISGLTITYLAAPLSTDRLRVCYRY